MKLEEMKDIADFVNGIDGVTSIIFNDLEAGTTGYCMFYEKDGEEVSINPVVQLFHPASVISLSDLDYDEGLRQINECLTTDGWKPFDNPKMRLLGFINQQPMDSILPSQAFTMQLTSIHALDKELVEKIMKWREFNSQIEFIPLKQG